MISNRRTLLIGFGFAFAMIKATPGVVRAQERVLFMPVFSVEAVSVNSVPIANSPVGKVTVAPGDVIMVKLFVRNWSPNGQKLRAYQVQLDPAGFKSGASGTIQPVGYIPGTPNDANAYIDLKDPDFVQKELQSIPLTDSAAAGYRWLNVLINGDEGPVSAQDGKKYYCGTVRLLASPDASGAFKIAVVEEPATSGLLDPANNPILPVGYEPLTVEVRSGVRWLRIESSDPPNGAIDGRIALSSAGRNDPAWKSIKLIFNSDATGLTAKDFTVEDGSPSPPQITVVKSNGSEVTAAFDRGIRSGAWTTITHKSSGSSSRIGRLPGDVNNDGRTDADDFMMLISGLNGAEKLPLYRSDLDGNGVFDTHDVLRIIDLLTGKQPNRTRLTK